MPSLIFKHTEKKETGYLNQLFEEKEWFESNNFPVFLPPDKNNIEKAILKEKTILNKKIPQLKKDWGKIEKEYFKIIKKLKHRKLLKKYICHISCFGPEGKYCPPNLLFVRLRTKQDENRSLETIGHELLHLIFRDYFQSRNLDYAGCESMVDAIIIKSNLNKIFPHYQKQTVGKIRKKLLKSILAG
jgi:hypothetical protein